MNFKNMLSGALIVMNILLFSPFSGSGNQPDPPDIESVKIGAQEWMAENLDVSTFRNGDSIARAGTRTDWQQANFNKEPAWCFYGNDPLNGEKYGRLYNWYAVNDPRGLAPAGWHVPADTEWQQLFDYLGGEDAAGMKMKNSSGWKDNGNGTNESRFSALPGGACADDGFLGSVGYLGVWWSATPDTAYYYNREAYAWYRSLYSSKKEVIRYSHSKGNGFSVRCVRD